MEDERVANNVTEEEIHMLFQTLDDNSNGILELGRITVPTIGCSRARGVWHTNFGINYGSISVGQLSGYIVFCILLIGGAKLRPPYK